MTSSMKSFYFKFVAKLFLEASSLMPSVTHLPINLPFEFTYPTYFLTIVAVLLIFVSFSSVLTYEGTVIDASN